ncbi:MAG: 3-phosphoshikimate 1-carboxyvinyltransferase [Verrucomicrobiota bacterium]
MPLPALIEIVPLGRPVHAEISVPGSKSITNRALILAALTNGESTLQGALWSEDTQVMADCLQKLGFRVGVRPDPAEFCNRTIIVNGLGGKIPGAGTVDKPLELFVGNAGTAARFLTALVCLGRGVYHLQGVPRMHERPQAALFQALRKLGYRIDSSNDKLPAVIHGTGPRPAKCTVSIEESSQFASALMLCAKAGCWHIEVIGENAEESPYVAMTSKLVGVFPPTGGIFQIEADASSGSYFLAAGSYELLEAHKSNVSGQNTNGFMLTTRSRPTVTVVRWPTSGWQIDQQFVFPIFHLTATSTFSEEAFRDASERAVKSFAEALGSDKTSSGTPPNETVVPLGEHPKPRTISRQRDLGDSIMTAIVLAPLAEDQWTFTDLGRLRVQECERVVALRTELSKCGAKVIEEGDALVVHPAKLHGAEIETYNDHRMAMCFAILGLKVPGIKIKNPACVKKTFPNFFQKLAASPPSGLGATILDAMTGKRLSVEELFAE